MTIRLLAVAAAIFFACTLRPAQAGVLLGGDALAGGFRWDAAPREINGNERSLDGGLRYSLQGSTFEAFRDLLHWNQLPSVEDFQQAVDQAFAAWTTVDPVSGLYTDITFVADLATPVVGSDEFAGFNTNGAEIDLLALDGGLPTFQARTGFQAIERGVTLTSGVNDPDSRAISGIDITFNNNAGAVISSLDIFRRLLTHEIGHALGLNDLEAAKDVARFIDDNYDGSTSATAVATLYNSWALQVDPYDPSASPLNVYIVADGNPGIDTPGVDLLMESNGLGISDPGNPASNLVPLTNDDYAMRQFLYPSLERDVDTTGDYNGNGIVDAADYTVWRDTFGQTLLWPGVGADGDLSGTIDQGDYDFWKERFGDVISTEAPTESLAVPEPTAVLLWAITLFVGGTAESRRCHRRRRSCHST